MTSKNDPPLQAVEHRAVGSALHRRGKRAPRWHLRVQGRPELPRAVGRVVAGHESDEGHKGHAGCEAEDREAHEGDEGYESHESEEDHFAGEDKKKVTVIKHYYITYHRMPPPTGAAIPTKPFLNRVPVTPPSGHRGD